VRFGKYAATIKKASAVELRVLIPGKCRRRKSYAVKVTVNGSTSNEYLFQLK